MTKTRLGFLVSHRGSNMQAVIDACNQGRLQGIPAVVISNNASSQALERARKESIPGYVVNAKSAAETDGSPDEIMLRHLLEHRVDIVVLAGYMKKVGSAVLNRFAGRILNIHPSLLPDYGGRGMFGLRVHEAVLAARASETGATVHLVDEHYDQGPILAQRKVRVLADDSPETLASRVLEAEHELLVDTLAKVIRGEITTPLTNRSGAC
ncbi:MAG: phosphoribosylglycinamide formyltransferase [Gammaproteobacteria bacterium]